MCLFFMISKLFISEKAFFTQHTSWLINVWIDRFSEKDRARLDMIWTASEKSDFSGIETRSIEIMLKKDINVDFSKIGNDVIQSEHPRIMQAKESKLTFDEVSICVNTIKSARENQDEKVVKELLLKYVDGYTSELL